MLASCKVFDKKKFTPYLYLDKRIAVHSVSKFPFALGLMNFTNLPFLLPPSQQAAPPAPTPAPWVVMAGDRARYDVMFRNADLDRDGFVSGQEIRGVFLQSGLPQMVLAHIW